MANSRITRPEIDSFEAFVAQQDWSATALGALNFWPASLRSAMDFCLSSAFPIGIVWGTELTFLYNEAMADMIGDKHPEALGRPYWKVWPELREKLAPVIDQVLNDGEGIFSPNEPLLVWRDSIATESYVNLSFSPLRETGGEIMGVMITAAETTQTIVSERRIELLREVSRHASGARSQSVASLLVMEPLEQAGSDIPFALLYLVDEEQNAVLVQHFGLPGDEVFTPERVDLRSSLRDPPQGWPFRRALTKKAPLFIELDQRFSSWPEQEPKARQAAILPLFGTRTNDIQAFLIAGVNPLQPLNKRHRRFYERLADAVQNALVLAHTLELEHRRSSELATLTRTQRQTERDLAGQEARYRALFESIEAGFCVLKMYFDEAGRPVDYLFEEMNKKFEEHTGLIDPVGRTARELIPDLDESWYRIYGDVALTGEPVRFENQALAMDRWFDVYAFRTGAAEEHRVALLFNDITARKRRELNAEFLAQISAVLAQLTEPAELMEAAGSAIADHLKVDRVAFGAVSEEGNALEVIYEHRAAELPSAMGSYRFSDYLSKAAGKALQNGAPVILNDVLSDSHTAEKAQAYEYFQIRAQLTAPHLSDGRLRFLLAVYHNEPYRWRDDEIELLQDLTTRIWLRLERAYADEQLREADRRKDRFMAILSHELRNPLAPIKNSLYILEHSSDHEAKDQAREILKRQVGQLAHLVDDLLDVTRVTSDKIQLRRENLELGELIERTLDDHRSLFAGRELTLEFKRPDESLCVDGDPSRLAQVVGNLLQNSAKFTPPGGQVTVELSEKRAGDEQMAVISVRDSGMGIDEQTLEGLFEPFMQADVSLDHSSGGLGLGLALVKGLVELHGGQVCAISEGLDKGAEFRVTLPLTKAKEPPKEKKTVPVPTNGALCILVIEDNADVATILKTILEMNGHDTAIAYTGPEGLERARAIQPDVILCDIGLPGMSGFEVAQAIRADFEKQPRCLIALSGYAMPEDVDRSKNAGFDHHIAKPPDLNRLQAILSSVARQP